MEEFGTSKASFWVTLSLLLHLIFVLISLVLSFFVFIIILYNCCNRVFSDQSSNAVCRCLCRGCCYFNTVYKTNQLTGNVYNDSEVTMKVKEDIRSCYAKYVFLLGKINNVIMSLVLLGLFTDRNDAFSYPFIYFS